MPISDRINNWVEDRRKVWGEALGNFFLGAIAKGTTKSLEDLEPGVIDQIRENVQLFIDNPNTPPEAKRMLEKAITEGNIMEVVLGWMLTLLGLLPMILGQGAPLGRIMEQVQEGNLRSQILDPFMALQLWRRDKEKYANVMSDLIHGGWSDERIAALKVITEVIPNAADIVRFALREVYSPEIAKAYGQFLDIPTDAYKDAERAGLSTDMFDKYWAAHWGLPSASDGFELLHRGILTEDELKGLLKANDIMPYWRDKLIKLSWNIPTRVDVRRFWDMRTIDETRLREIYTGLGYHAQDLEDYVLWTKIYVDFPDLLARYKNGWITLDQVKSELVTMGMKPERADTMIEEKIKKAAPERVAKERDLTAAEIIKGIKKGVITDSEGAELLQDMGYSADEAWFKIAIEVAALAGSPETYADFKDITQKWRLATGMEGKPMTEEIKKAAAEVVRLSGEVASLESSIKAEKAGLVGEEVLPEETTKRLKGLQVKLHRAESALILAKTDYNAKLAEWRHRE